MAVTSCRISRRTRARRRRGGLPRRSKWLQPSHAPGRLPPLACLRPFRASGSEPSTLSLVSHLSHHRSLIGQPFAARRLNAPVGGTAAPRAPNSATPSLRAQASNRKMLRGAARAGNGRSGPQGGLRDPAMPSELCTCRDARASILGSGGSLLPTGCQRNGSALTPGALARLSALRGVFALEGPAIAARLR